MTPSKTPAIALCFLLAGLPAAAADAPPAEEAEQDLRLELWWLSPAVAQGSDVNVWAQVWNAGPTTIVGATGELWIDGERYVSGPYTLEPGDFFWVGAYWTASRLGYHTVSAYADPAHALAETNESNNFAIASFEVQPVQDVAIEIVGIEHEPLRTDVAEAPHPAGRHIVTVRVTNADPTRDAKVRVDLYESAQPRHQDELVCCVSSFGQVASGTGRVPAGGSALLELVWDPLGVGDVQLDALVDTVDAFDLARDDNADSARDFVVVGGLGGLFLG